MIFLGTAILAIAGYGIFILYRSRKDKAALSELYSILRLRGEVEHARGNLEESGRLYAMASALHEARSISKTGSDGADAMLRTLLRTTDPSFLESLVPHASNNHGKWDYYGALMRLCGRLESGRK